MAKGNEIKRKKYKSSIVKISMDVNEQSRTIFLESNPSTLYNFGGIRITAKYLSEETKYNMSIFGSGFYFNSNQFQNLVNSKSIEELAESMEKIKSSMHHAVEDNDAYFIARRALQEAKKMDMKILGLN